MRRLISRLLLLVLVGVVGYALVRFIVGPGDGDAVVSFGDGLGADQLRHRAFEVEQPVPLALHAVGSFETDSTLAATAWIVRRDSQVVVWQMDPSALSRGRGTLVTVDDTLTFAPGVYDAYFASFGDPLTRGADAPDGSFLGRARALLSRDGRAWLGDAGRWRFDIDFANPAADRSHATALRGSDEDPEDNSPRPAGLVWTSGPVGHAESREYVFEVTAPTTLRLRATGEVADGRVRDGAAMLRFATNDTLWAMPAAPTTWAGGSRKNRRAEATLTLEPGFYRALYRTDNRHDYDHWDANPPYDPVSWGLTVLADSASADRIVAFDPWNRLPVIAAFTCVGEDELREDAFTLPDTTTVLLEALGEIIGSSAYDYATLLRRPPDSPSGPQPVTEVWTMSRENTQHAGGASKNRAASAVLTLQPGTYILRYRSDGSHDCSDFNSSPPPVPERWGATLFALDPDFDLASIERPDPRTRNRERRDALQGQTLADLTRLGNNARVTASFTLDEAATVRLYALGEIVPSGAYDYGWITDEDGDEVWRMTRENTRLAGGAKQNRVFDGTLRLGAGTYTVHFETDGGHAFGDFSQPPPNDPEAWGIRVWHEAEEA